MWQIPGKALFPRLGRLPPHSDKTGRGNSYVWPYLKETRRLGDQEVRRPGGQEVRWARSQREANEVPTSRQTFQGADVLALLFLKRKEARASSTVTWTEPVHSVPSQCENQCQLIFQFQCSSVPVFQCHCLRPECHQSLHRAGAPGSRFPSGENSVARCPNNSVPGCRQQFWSSCL